MRQAPVNCTYCCLRGGLVAGGGAQGLATAKVDKQLKLNPEYVSRGRLAEVYISTLCGFRWCGGDEFPEGALVRVYCLRHEESGAGKRARQRPHGDTHPARLYNRRFICRMALMPSIFVEASTWR
jgi:hypothetical protein